MISEDILTQIRKIRDTFGDDKCWKDWHELFAMLPEGFVQTKRDIQVQLKDCERYLQCTKDQTEYVPPPRWVKGKPDKTGLWVLKYTGRTDTLNVFHISQTDFISDNIIKSFGPIP